MPQKGFTVWFTGLSGSGKSTISGIVHRRLKEMGVTNIEMLDGEVLRERLSDRHASTRDDRVAHIVRIGWVAHLLTKNGVPNLVAAVSPYRDAREEVRRMIEHAGGKGSFVEVFVDCPLEECRKRDPRGVYSGAGKGRHVIGVDEPYEPPHAPEVRLRTDSMSAEEGAGEVLKHLRVKGLI